MHELTGARSTPSDDVVITFVGGGSRMWGRRMMSDLALCDSLSGTVRLYDVDHEAATANAAFGEWVQEREDAVGDWTYRAEEDLGTALDGADFAFLSTQDPPDETFYYDVEHPKEYGIYQSVGDTVGPGGVMRAMRSIPQYRRIAAAIREHAPDAWVVNFTNPMTVCTRTLYAEYPDINAIGVCHEIYRVQEFFADLAATYLDDRPGEPTASSIDLNVKGINHFTWVDEARWRGADLMPLVDRKLADEAPLPHMEPGGLDPADTHINHDHVALDLYRQFGREALAAAGDRHLAEFVPWYLAVDDPLDVQRWGINLTPGEERAGRWDRAEATRESYLRGDEAFDLEASGEEMVDILTALTGGEALKTNVNLPNAGQVSGLPDGAVVETNALFTAGSVTALAAGSLPDGVETITRTHVANQEALVEAGFTGDLDRAFQAFLTDPLVTIDREAARSLFTELVAIEREYLDDWQLDDAAVLDGVDLDAVAAAI